LFGNPHEILLPTIYVASESYKYARLFPLTQQDLMQMGNGGSSSLIDKEEEADDSPMIQFADTAITSTT
jgi:hypothetical protein